MNSKQILSAMNNISSEYILSAQKKLEYDSEDAPKNQIQVKGHRTIRRTLSLAAAVILILSVCFTTALAVSPEFREFVFAFFNITEPEIIPENVPDESAPNNMEVEEGQINIGGVIEGTYIHFPNMSAVRNGIFTVCTDDVQMNSGSQYDAYYEKDGEFIRLEEKTFDQTYNLFGNDIHVTFDWVEHNGTVATTFIESEAPFVKFSGAGDVTSTLMWLQIDPPGEETFGYYPVLINVRTGELTDMCAGLGVENMRQIRQAAISDDLTQLLIVDWDKNIYYVDLVDRKLYPIDDLLGQKCAACVLVDGKLIAWSENYGSVTVRVFDPATWESRETYSGRPMFLRGFNSSILSSWMYRGTRFALEVDANHDVYVIDLLNGQRSIIDGFKWQENNEVVTECVPSADGNKVLIYSRGATTYYESIGVLDFSNRAFVKFSRENVGNVNEHSAYWFDNDSVVIATSGDDDTRQYYIYRLLDK